MARPKVALIIGLFILVFVGTKVFQFMYMLNPEITFGPTGVKKHHTSNSSEHLVWIIQISDLHLSMFRDSSRLTEFSDFCNTTLDVIKPSVVLATGDLTDGVYENEYTTGEVEEDWIFYRDTLQKNNVLQKTVWLDIRGNHDNFNVLNANSVDNYFRKYGIQGPEHLHSYLLEYKMKNGESISFIAVDACLEIGIKRPFNFIGMLPDDDLKVVQNFSDIVTANLNSKYLIWFGHYPTSTILPPAGDKLRDLITSNKKSVVYVSGHLHTLVGLIPNMYAYQNGFFELELGDWRKNRMFRIMAIDEGQFSFVDVTYNDWPYILVTHPKPATLASLADKSDIYTEQPEYIKLLVFSPSRIVHVMVQIGSKKWEYCEHMDGPLYVLQWNPLDFYNGLQIMKINVKDESGRNKVISHVFSLDGSRLNFKWLSRFILIPNVKNTFQLMFYMLILLSIAPFIILRLVNISIKNNWVHTPHLDFKCGYCYLRRFWLLSNIDKIVTPLVIYPVYLTVGPWMVADLVDGHVGVVFPWGCITNWTYIPATPSYIIGSFRVLMLHIPMLFVFASYIDERSYRLVYSKKRLYSAGEKFSFIWTNTIFIILCVFQLYEMLIVWRTFGIWSVLLSPFEMGWLLLIIWIRYKILTLSKDQILFAVENWIATNRM